MARNKKRRKKVRRRRGQWKRGAKQRVRRLYRLRKAAGRPWGSIKKMRARMGKAWEKMADKMLARLRRYNTRSKAGRARAKKNLRANQVKLLSKANTWLKANGGRLAVAARRRNPDGNPVKRRRRSSRRRNPVKRRRSSRRRSSRRRNPVKRRRSSRRRSSRRRSSRRRNPRRRRASRRRR